MAVVSELSLLRSSALTLARERLAEHFSVDAVESELDWEGRAALDRGDLPGAARVLGGSATATLVRAFLLAEPVPEPELRGALGVALVDGMVSAGLVTVGGDQARAEVEIRPYAEAGASTTGASYPGADSSWWVVSDFGADVRPGPLKPDHVLGIGAAALTLAQATIRPAAGSALDVGTGCGVQALHLSRHCDAVTASDISRRCLSFAATSAALSGVELTLAEGSLLEPVSDRTFDLIVCNPPFVISPGSSHGPGFTYRDGGRAADDLCRELVGGLGDRLTDGGTAQLLANWAITADETAEDRVLSWLPAGLDAWIWQREVADPGEYVSMWLRDAGEVPGTPAWRTHYDRWRTWLHESGIRGIGMGLISLRRRSGSAPVVCFEDVRQPLEQPVSPEISGWFNRTAWLAGSDDEHVLASRLEVGPDVRVLASRALRTTGWEDEVLALQRTSGMRWELDTDETVVAVLAACQTGATPGIASRLLAEAAGLAPDTVQRRTAPLVRDLIQRGFLLPPGTGTGASG